jgi:hypothetical protein
LFILFLVFMCVSCSLAWSHFSSNILSPQSPNLLDYGPNGETNSILVVSKVLIFDFWIFELLLWWANQEGHQTQKKRFWNFHSIHN